MRESERREDTLDEREQEKERVTPVLCFQYSMHLKESKNPLQISRANVIASAFRLKCHMNSNWSHILGALWNIWYYRLKFRQPSAMSFLTLSFSLFIRSFVTKAYIWCFFFFVFSISTLLCLYKLRKHNLFCNPHAHLYVSDPIVCVSLNWSPPRQHSLMLLVMSQSSDIDFRDDSAYLFSSATVYWSL